MGNTLFVILVPIGMFTILALILWGPTVFLLFRKRRRGEIVPLGRFSGVLVAELLVASVLVAIADLMGLRNPGGYILATAVVVGAAGAYVFSRAHSIRDS
jgi:hypothetical protein